MSQTKKRIAITSIGSGVGQSVVDSCRLSNLPLELFGYGSEALAYGNFDCDHWHLVPGIYDDEYLTALLERCEQDRIDVLVPGLDDELHLLATNRHLFEARGIYLPIPSADVIRLCRDKAAMSHELCAHGDAFVESYELADALERYRAGRLALPLIAKPKSGFASRGVFVVAEEQDFGRVSSAHILQSIAGVAQSDPNHAQFAQKIAQGIVPQVSELSAQLVFDRRGGELGRFLSCNTLRGGIPVEISPVDLPEVWQAIDKFLPVLRAHGVKGPLNIQGRLTSQGPKFFEMNARFTGITGLRAMMGFNEVASVIADALGMPQPAGFLRQSARKIGVRQVANRVLDFARTDRQSETFSQKTVLVTGANGFLGQELVQQLARESNVGQIVAVVREADAGEFVRNLSDDRAYQRKLHIVAADDLCEGRYSIGQVDVICHLASGRPDSPPQGLAAALAFTRILTTLAVSYQIGGFVHASTQAVYGRRQAGLWRESDLVAPLTPYAHNKWAAELMTRSLPEINPSTAATSLRFSQLYGGSALHRVRETPHAMLINALEKGRIVVQGGAQTVDVLPVQDAAAAIVALVNRPTAQWPQLANIGSGAPVAVLTLAEEIAGLLRREFGREVVVEQQTAGSQDSFGLDISLAKAQLDWAPAADRYQVLTEFGREYLANTAASS